MFEEHSTNIDSTLLHSELVQNTKSIVFLIYSYVFMHINTYVCIHTNTVLNMVCNIYILYMCVCIYVHTMFYSDVRILHAKSAFNENIKSMTLGRCDICLQVENLPV